MRTRTLVAVATVAALGLAGCGTGDEVADDGDTIEDQDGAPAESPIEQDSPTAAPSPQATGTAGGGATVVVEAISFQDQSVTVEAGTPVTWVNQDDVAHTVTAGQPDDPDEPATNTFDEDLPAGGQVTITVDQPGTYPYYCEIHQQMTAELVVEPATG